MTLQHNTLPGDRSVFKSYTRKNILRRTLGTKLPHKLMKASKKGFCIPLSMRTKIGESIDQILAENICKAAKNGILREQAVLDLLI